MSAKHTPGPWLVEPSRNGAAFDIRIRPQDATIAIVWPPETWLPHLFPERLGEPEANAKLIAAAPTLADRVAARLEACTSLSGCGSREEHPQECVDCKADRAALRAAGRLP